MANPEAVKTYIENEVNNVIEIWKDVQVHYRNPEFANMGNADKFDYFYKKYPDLCKKYPVPLKYAICLKLFHPKAFRSYVKRMMDTGISYKGPQGLAESSADYVIMLCRAKYPKSDMTKLHELRAQVAQELEDERKEFFKLQDDAKKRVDEREARLAEERKKELKEYIKKKISAQASEQQSDNTSNIQNPQE